MSETPFQAKDEQLVARIESFRMWLKKVNSERGPMEKAVRDYSDCPYCLVAAYFSLMDIPFSADAADARCICKKKPRTGNGTYSGAWAFTITMSPKDSKTVGDMLAAVRKVMKQQSCPVTKYAWYYEEKGRNENGDPIHPHIHGMYETTTGGRIERKHWKRAWDIWDETKPLGAGFRGGYHRPVRSNEGYTDYIKKDGGMHESFGLDDGQTE